MQICISMKLIVEKIIIVYTLFRTITKKSVKKKKFTSFKNQYIFLLCSKYEINIIFIYIADRFFIRTIIISSNI